MILWDGKGDFFILIFYWNLGFFYCPFTPLKLIAFKLCIKGHWTFLSGVHPRGSLWRCFSKYLQNLCLRWSDLRHTLNKMSANKIIVLLKLWNWSRTPYCGFTPSIFAKIRGITRVKKTRWKFYLSLFQNIINMFLNAEIIKWKYVDCFW